MDSYSLVGEPYHERKNNRAKQNRLFRSEAQATLMSGDNYYKSILAHLICVLMSGGFFYAGYLVIDYGRGYGIGGMTKEAVDAFTLCLCVILCLIGAFMLFAFLFGAYRLSCEMNADLTDKDSMEASSVSVILSPLSTKKDFRNTLVIFFILSLELFICAAPTVFVLVNAGTLGLNGFAVFMIKAFTVACSIFLGLFFVFLLLPLPYIVKNGAFHSPFRMYKESAKAALTDIWLGYNMLISFTFWLILSFLSFGVLYFAYTMPYMTHSMAKVGEYLYNLSITERNDINET